MNDYLTGTLTFLLTDIEGSTELWDRYPEQMRSALAQHDAIIEGCVEAYHGRVVRPRGEGDSRFAVFPVAEDAVRAAVEVAQRLAGGFEGLPFPLKARIGMHTGAADLRMGDYYGSTVNRCARIRGLARGGQVLLSQVTAGLVQDSLPPDVSLIDLGTHALRGLSRGEKIYQLRIPGLANEFPPLPSATGFESNLPVPPTNFIGRARDVSAVSDLLLRKDVRLVTLTGMGGTGKTRLSLEVGRALLEDFAQGVYFVDLASLSNPGLVAPTIARSMGIGEAGRPPLESLKDYLADKAILAILDNFEQVTAAAPVVAELLASAPGFKVLATSRIPLQLRGEHEYPVSPLVLPLDEEPHSVEEYGEFEAVKLFVQQAQSVLPGFELTRENAPAVAEICRRLDGLPLAIEIAAARVKLLPPRALLKRLDKSLKLLVGGPADLPERHQTLRNAIDWSYNLLKPEEQRLFARLGIFVGGFSLEAAESVCGLDGDSDVFAGVETLFNSSLLNRTEALTGDTRFEMLETIREYALERLAESGEMEALREKHARYFGGIIVQQAAGGLYSVKALEWLNWLESELDNIRATLDWSLAHPDLGAGLAFGLVWFWYRRGYFMEGGAWAERFLSTPSIQPPTPLRVMALMAAGMMALWQGNQERALARLQEGLAIAEKIEDDELVGFLTFVNGVALINMGRDNDARPLLEPARELFGHMHSSFMEDASYILHFTTVHLGNVELGLGNPERARALHEEAYAKAREIGENWLISFALNNLGEVARTQGQYDLARQYYEECQELLRDTGDKGDMARFAHSLGYIALHEGDYARAEEQFRHSLALFRKLGNRRGMAECMAGLAGLKARLGNPAWGAVMISAAERVLKETGGAWWPADRVEVEQNQEIMRAALDEAAYAAALEKGKAMTLEQALAFAAQEVSTRSEK